MVADARCATGDLVDWLDLDLATHPRAWATLTAEALLARPEASRDPGPRRRLAGSLESCARSVAAAGGRAAYVLLPAADLQVRTVARLLTLDLPAGMTATAAQDHLLRAMVPPTDRVVGRVQVSDLATPAGQAQRLALRLREADGGDSDHRSVLWVAPELRTAVLLTMAFHTRLESSYWSSSVDDLAATLQIGAGAAPGS